MKAAGHALLGALVLSSLASAAHAGPGLADFEQAYRRERTELLAEREALGKQLEQLRRANAGTAAGQEAELRALEEELAATRQRQRLLEERRVGLEERLAGAEDGGERLEAMLDSAPRAIRGAGGQVELADAPEKALGQALEAARDRTRQLSRLRVEPGTFFDASGAQLEGQLVHIGRVAALGVAPGAAGVLAPAPGGGWRLIDDSAPEQARALAAGEQVDSARLFLFDPLAEPRLPRAERTLLETTQAGGLIAWIILGLGLLALAVVFERLAVLGYHAIVSERRLSRMSQLVAAGERAEALRAAGGGATAFAAQLLRRGDAGRAQLEELAADALQALLPRLERFLVLLEIIAAVAPLLGLLGTVTGMIATFEVITEHGTGEPRLLSGGISEALITTEFGLAVAIPTLVAFTLLSKWVDRLLGSLQGHAVALVQQLAPEQRPEEPAASLHEVRPEEVAHA